MYLNSELSDIIITIDTREQNKKRIKAVEEWAQAHGAIIEHSKLDLCDYVLLGEFRGVPVNLGIEAKGLSDFASSFQDLPNKLARAYTLYDNVALFIEANNYSFQVDSDGFHATISNPNVRNGDADVLPLAVYENMLASFQMEGVHVRQLRSEAHFPYAIAGLLINITRPLHTGLTIKDKSFTSQYLNVLGKVPGIGYKKAQKLIECYSNMFWLCSASEESYKEVLGKVTGYQLYNFIRNPELIIDLIEAVPDFSNKIKQAIVDDNDKNTGVFIPPPKLSPVLLSNQKKECTNESVKDFDNCQREQIEGCENCKSYQGIITSHPGSSSTIPLPKPGDTQDVIPPPPIQRPDVQGAGFKKVLTSTLDVPAPATTFKKKRVQKKDLELASSIESLPSSALTPDEELFGKTNSDWIVETHKMSARTQLEAYLQSPHTLQECVDRFSLFTPGTIYEHITRMKRDGVVIEFNDKTLVMTGSGK